MMTIMVIRGCTLEGAATGLEFYLKPDFSRLSDSVVMDRFTQNFVTPVAYAVTDLKCHINTVAN